MTLTTDLKANYEAVLRDLEIDRAQVQQQLAALQAQLRELQGTILNLSKRITPDAQPKSLATSRPTSHKYANISVRWAILDILMDSVPMSTAEIAKALKASGVQSKAANFANNVSAVLTTTMKEHSEVEQSDDGKWRLSANGMSAIDHIRSTPKFQRGCGLWSAKPRKV